MPQDYRKVAMPTVMVFQPDINRLLDVEAKDDLASWEQRIADWSGVRFGAEEILSSGGTCTDSGNDCDVD
jgi:hypothetical protein